MSSLYFLASFREHCRTIFDAAAAQRQRLADERERAAIARAFNDRYCYRKFYAIDQRSWQRNEHAWMCPSCNAVHRPKTNSVWSGLQYPACCAHGEGHRLSEGIKTS